MRFFIWFHGERYAVFFNGVRYNLLWIDPEVLNLIFSAASFGVAIHDVSREKHIFTEGA